MLLDFFCKCFKKPKARKCIVCINIQIDTEVFSLLSNCDQVPQFTVDQKPNNINNGSVLFKCPIVPVSHHTQYKHTETIIIIWLCNMLYDSS